MTPFVRKNSAHLTDANILASTHSMEVPYHVAKHLHYCH